MGLIVDAAWRGVGVGGEKEDCKDVLRNRRGGGRNNGGALNLK